MRTFPFAYPEFSAEDEQGQQTVSYPSSFTDGLFPQIELHPRMRVEQGDQDDVVVRLPVPKKRKGEDQHAPRVKSKRKLRGGEV